MIKISHLTKNFTDVIAVNDLTIDIPLGISGLVGENGAGKSTLFRLIADVYQPTSGSIYIDDIPNDDKKAKTNLFFLSEDPFYEKNASVSQTLLLYHSLFPLSVSKCQTMLTKLSLPLNRKVNTFSKGMKRQLFLCIALAMDVNYYLLDEAFDGVDPLTIEVLKEFLIDETNKDKTYVISSHNIAQLSQVCENYIVLSKGKLIKQNANVDFAQTYVKYQIITPLPLDGELLETLGLKVMSFRKVGSIYHVVFIKQEDLETILKENIDITLLENIPLEASEIMIFEMNNAKKAQEKEGNEYEI